MNRRMTGLADLDPRLHLFPGVPLFEPFVAVEGPGDEMVEVVGVFRFAEFAKHSIVHYSRRQQLLPAKQCRLLPATYAKE